ncbi:DUF1799 domain-containing protein [Luteimonas sp. FXH3W]|uniref:DUF1799 domain-containing protein n=1 Tax=Aquilutibacter rugosus TaxID=3115820 RepID=A0ABU7UVP5_9GAMM
MRGDAGDAPVGDEWVEVLACNARSVEVWCACKPAWLVTANAAVYQGITALEAMAACDLLGIPVRARRRIFNDIQRMSQVASAHYAVRK